MPCGLETVALRKKPGGRAGGSREETERVRTSLPKGKEGDLQLAAYTVGVD